MMDGEVMFARCKSGARWFWTTFDWEDTPRPLEYGYEATAEGAEGHLPPGVRHFPANYAKFCLKYLSAKRKAERCHRDTQEVRENEFLYTRSDPFPHRIVKKTRKKVFVERGTWDRAEELWQRYYGLECIALDRAALERDGRAWSSRWRDFYYATPHERHADEAPECLRALGLPRTATEQEVRREYRRRVRQAHPDSGGSHEAFVVLHQAYEQALALTRAGQDITFEARRR